MYENLLLLTITGENMQECSDSQIKYVYQILCKNLIWRSDLYQHLFIVTTHQDVFNQILLPL